MNQHWLRIKRPYYVSLGVFEDLSSWTKDMVLFSVVRHWLSYSIWRGPATSQFLYILALSNKSVLAGPFVETLPPSLAWVSQKGSAVLLVSMVQVSHKNIRRLPFLWPLVCKLPSYPFFEFAKATQLPSYWLVCYIILWASQTSNKFHLHRAMSQYFLGSCGSSWATRRSTAVFTAIFSWSSKDSMKKEEKNPSWGMLS